MKSILKYFLLTIKHKYFVFIAGLKFKAPLWRLIIHDWTKFLPSELPHYGKQFFSKEKDPLQFIICWTKHRNRNYHHWEFWVPRTGHSKCNPPYNDNEPLPMPEWAIREMISDWAGASRAYNGKWPDYKNWIWVNENLPKMKLHIKTRQIIERIINENSK